MKNQPKYYYFIMALILALAVQIIWTISGAWIYELGSYWINSDKIGEQAVIRSDGTPMIQRYSPRLYNWEYFTLEGTKIEDKNIIVNYTHLYPPMKTKSLSNNWNQRINEYASASPLCFWYLIHDGNRNGQAYVEGYNPESREFLGYIGKKGLTQTPPSTQDQFHITLEYLSTHVNWPRAYEPWYYLQRVNSLDQTKTIVLGSEEAWEINLTQRSVQQIWKGKDAIDTTELVQSRGNSPNEDEEDRKPRRVIRTLEQLIFLSSTGSLDYSVQLPETLRKQYLRIHELPQGGFLLLTGVGDEPSRYYWFDKKGDIEKTREVILVKNKSTLSPIGFWFGIGIMVPAPTLFLTGIAIQTEETVENHDVTFMEAFTANFADAWPAFLIISILSFGLAIFVYRRQRALDQGEALGWAVFVFLFGLAGLAGYWWHRRWPICEACPRCRAIVPRDREFCLACKQEFPRPAQLSTEILC